MKKRQREAFWLPLPLFGFWYFGERATAFQKKARSLREAAVGMTHFRPMGIDKKFSSDYNKSVSPERKDDEVQE